MSPRQRRRELVVDANVLLRYLTNSPSALAEQAAALLEGAVGHHVRLVVAPLTLAEVVYVLTGVYGWQPRDVAHGLLDLLDSQLLVVLEAEVVRQALAWYRDVSAIDFADAYVAALALGRGHGLVATFDRDFQRLPDVHPIMHPSQLEG